jgi:hypothetical protein
MAKRAPHLGVPIHLRFFPSRSDSDASDAGVGSSHGWRDPVHEGGTLAAGRDKKDRCFSWIWSRGGESLSLRQLPLSLTKALRSGAFLL